MKEVCWVWHIKGGWLPFRQTPLPPHHNRRQPFTLVYIRRPAPTRRPWRVIVAHQIGISINLASPHFTRLSSDPARRPSIISRASARHRRWRTGLTAVGCLDHKQSRILINLVRTWPSNVKTRAWWWCHLQPSRTAAIPEKTRIRQPRSNFWWIAPSAN